MATTKFEVKRSLIETLGHIEQMEYRLKDIKKAVQNALNDLEDLNA